MKKSIFLIVVLIFILTGGLIYYFGTVKAIQSNTIKVSGTIEATETRLSFQVGGKIKKLFVDEGDYIEFGKIVAALDSDELMKTKNQVQANLEQARSDYELSEKNYKRLSELLKENAISEQDVDIAQNNFNVAKAKHEAAKNAYDLACIRLDYTNLSSQINGFITVKSAEAGEVVQPGSTVFNVVDMNDIWLTAYIPETDLGRIHLNQKVDVKTDTFPRKIYNGNISFISQESEFTPKYIQTSEERVKLVFRIKINIENSNFELKPGMPSDGYIKE